MKRLLVSATVFTLVAGLAACGQTDQVGVPAPTGKVTALDQHADPNQVASILKAGGWTSEKAQTVKDALDRARAYSNVSSQDLKGQSTPQWSLKEEAVAASTVEVMNALITQLKSQNLTPQWYKDNSDEASTVRNVALSNVDQFNYYSDTRFQRTNTSIMDWNTDGCSSPLGVLFVTDAFFRPACVVHDFGYRNGRVYYQTQTSSFKYSVDMNFYYNMISICSTTLFPAGCERNANGYYNAVRIPRVEEIYLNDQIPGPIV